jgi:hypothetical protein
MLANAAGNVTVTVVAVPTVVPRLNSAVVPDLDFAIAWSTEPASSEKWLSSGAILLLDVG